ncbi:hypothetical protein BH23THE1_BH23THE1_35180 [soil metagenome]
MRNVVYCFDLIWEVKENNYKTIKEKMHSELLFDLLSHDIGDYHQIIHNSLDIATFIVEKNNNITNSRLSQNNEEISYFLQLQKKQ